MSNQRQLEARIKLLEDTLRQAAILLKKQQQKAATTVITNEGDGRISFDDCVRKKMATMSDSDSLKFCQNSPDVDPTTKSRITWTSGGVTKYASVANKLLTLQNHYDGTINEIPSPVRSASTTDTYPAWLKTHDYLFQEYEPVAVEGKESSIKSAAIEDPRPAFIRTMDHTQERRRDRW